ncbi:hypothetical protein [Pedobacter cryotolerans]|uniref:Uncharacterized protein n=1 Tax=Pedobacter cryotolerans TaxID=2571270 RepID=A0A4V5NYE5_9SPHI|nr:hypothetical protein [Pedobacter cryotolerans]TKC03424.1 hypothetical protein FA045_02305 [Pedobacter cryotolerans]
MEFIQIIFKDMIVNNPSWRYGKILLKYSGNNIQLLNNNLRLDKVALSNEMINGYDEKLIFKINLFDNAEILLSLKSLNIFIKKDVWEIQESSLNSVTSIIVDNEYIIVKGSLSFCKEINEANRYLDTYEYDIIFENNGILISKLQEEDISFLDFR